MRRLLDFKELRAHGVIYTRRQIDRMEAKGKFPKRVRLGERRVAWVEKEIDEYVEALIAARNTDMGLGSLSK